MTVAPSSRTLAINSSRRALPVLTFALALVTLLASLPRLGPALQYDHALARNNLCRLITCHWTHYSSSHLIWSLGAFVVLGSICELQSQAKFLTCILLSSVIIPFGLYCFAPALDNYRGLSGIDSSLFFLACIPIIFQQWRDRQPTRFLATLLPVLFLAKLLYEQFTGNAIFVSAAGAFVPVPLAHLVGAAVGAACAAVPMAFHPRASDGRK